MDNPAELLSCNCNMFFHQQLMQISLPNGMFLFSLLLVKLSQKSRKCQRRAEVNRMDWTTEYGHGAAHGTWDQG